MVPQVPMFHHLTCDFAPHSHLANVSSIALVTLLVNAPEHPHATKVAVYPALLFLKMSRWLDW